MQSSIYLKNETVRDSYWNARNRNDEHEHWTRVLVVDNEPFVVETLHTYLSEGGYSTGVAHSGGEALRVFAEGAWDLIITDRAMPGMDGEHLAEHVKELAPGTPLILITGFAKPGTRFELFEETLLKPFSKPELLACVTRVFAQIAQRSKIT